MSTGEWIFYLMAACAVIAVPSMFFLRWQARRKIGKVATVQRAGALSPAPALPRSQPVASDSKLIAQERKAATSEQRVLSHAEWWPIVVEKAVHLRLIGPTASGKSVLAQAVASEFSGKLAIIDPVWKRGNWGGLPAITVDEAGDFAPIERGIKALLDEMKRRGAALQKEDNPTFERLTILFDEVPDTITELPETAGLLIRRVGQRGRHGNMHLIGMGQSERVKAWGLEGYGDMAQNFATIYLGDKATEKLPWVADVLEYPAVLEWRGKQFAIDTSRCLQLSRRAIPQRHVFVLDTTEPQEQQQGTNNLLDRVVEYLEDNADRHVSGNELERHFFGYTGGKANAQIKEVLSVARSIIGATTTTS